MDGQYENINAWIAARLRACREQKKVPISRMAVLTGKSAMSITNIERGQIKVSMEMALRYSRVLDIPLSQIIGEKEQELSPRLVTVLSALPPDKLEMLADAIPLLYPEYYPEQQ